MFGFVSYTEHRKIVNELFAAELKAVRDHNETIDKMLKLQDDHIALLKSYNALLDELTMEREHKDEI